MTILSESNRTCSECGSLLCHRDADCPTCETCGKRGHLRCSAGLPEAPPRIEAAPEVSLGCGADHKLGKVVLDLSVAGNKIRLLLDDHEVSHICKSLVSAAMELRKGSLAQARSALVMPRQPSPTLKFPRPK